MASLPFDKLRIDAIPFPEEYWSSLSPESRSFVEGLLTIDPVKRMTGGAVERRDAVVQWRRTPLDAGARGHAVATVPESILVAMREFGVTTRLKKAALTAVAYI